MVSHRIEKWEFRNYYALSFYRTSFTVQKRWLLAVSQLYSPLLPLYYIQLLVIISPFSSSTPPWIRSWRTHNSRFMEFLELLNLGLDFCGDSWKYYFDARLKFERFQLGNDFKFLGLTFSMIFLFFILKLDWVLPCGLNFGWN